jgi:AcrR family transcriptional regulator|tara:strand:- start:38 stop:679 length:642 start_codon:yes stop_codon:yes gene_type:complete
MNKIGDELNKNKALEKSDWVIAARAILISVGHSGLSLRRISSHLGATTGAFYWLFSNLEDLLNDLRDDWARENSIAFDRVFNDASLDSYAKYLGYVRVLLSEDDYNPQYDNAIRDWAYSSEPTAQILRTIDAKRINQLADMFKEIGFDQRSARVRARVTYFHQSGYYRMGINETLEERLVDIPYYSEILLGNNFISPDHDLEEIRRRIFGEKS